MLSLKRYYSLNEEFTTLCELYYGSSPAHFWEQISEVLYVNGERIVNNSKHLLSFCDPKEMMFVIFEKEYNSHSNDYYMYYFFPLTHKYYIYTGDPELSFSGRGKVGKGKDLTSFFVDNLIHNDGLL